LDALLARNAGLSIVIAENVSISVSFVTFTSNDFALYGIVSLFISLKTLNPAGCSTERILLPHSSIDLDERITYENG
jgi:hypothetical protein